MWQEVPWAPWFCLCLDFFFFPRALANSASGKPPGSLPPWGRGSRAMSCLQGVYRVSPTPVLNMPAHYPPCFLPDCQTPMISPPSCSPSCCHHHPWASLPRWQGKEKPSPRRVMESPFLKVLLAAAHGRVRTIYSFSPCDSRLPSIRYLNSYVLLFMHAHVHLLIHTSVCLSSAILYKIRLEAWSP